MNVSRFILIFELLFKGQINDDYIVTGDLHLIPPFITNIFIFFNNLKIGLLPSIYGQVFIFNENQFF